MDFPNGEHVYTLAPNRNLIMSYFKGCAFPHYFSADQEVRMWDALDNLNRQNLVSVTPPAPMSLQARGTATAGPIDGLDVVRLNQRRIVTAVRGGGMLKLIVWDVSADG